MLWVAAKLRVKMNTFVMDDPNTYYLVNGVKKRTYAVKNNPGLLGYKVEPSEMGMSADELLQQALQKVRNRKHSSGFNVNLAVISVEDLLNWFMEHEMYQMQIMDPFTHD